MSLAISSLLPQPLNNTRADLLSLKQRLATLLPQEQGKLYWTSLGQFVTGKINREEWGRILKGVMSGLEGEGVPLHNALLLSILYNTSRPPPSASQRHTTWSSKRSLSPSGTHEQIEQDPKKRRMKEKVMALGKRERGEIKMRKVKEERRGEGGFRESGDTKGTKVVEGLPILLVENQESKEVGAKVDTLALQQEYLRCLQVPLCCESKSLPDVETLRDRMSLVAYDSGLGGGADSKVAALGVLALEAHLKSILTSAISLIRHNRTLGLPTASLSQILSQHPSNTISDESIPSSTANPGLTTCDFSSLFDIAPHLLVKSHVGAVEKLYAIAPPSDASSSSDSSSDEQDSGSEGEQQKEVDEKKKSMKRPITAGVRPISGLTNNVDNVNVINVGLGGGGVTGSSTSKTRSRNPTRYNSISSPGVGGREQYLIDPSAISIPLGHPDVSPQPLPVTSPHPSQSGPSRKPSLINLKNGGNGGGGGTSPNSIALRLQLFPELDPTSTTTSGILEELVQSPNSTSSDEGSEEEEEEKSTAVGMGTGMIPPGGASGRNSISSSSGNVSGNGIGNGRKLWEVVDSHRLLNDLI